MSFKSFPDLTPDHKSLDVLVSELSKVKNLDDLLVERCSTKLSGRYGCPGSIVSSWTMLEGWPMWEALRFIIVESYVASNKQVLLNFVEIYKNELIATFFKGDTKAFSPYAEWMVENCKKHQVNLLHSIKDPEFANYYALAIKVIQS